MSVTIKTSPNIEYNKSTHDNANLCEYSNKNETKKNISFGDSPSLKTKLGKWAFGWSLTASESAAGIGILKFMRYLLPLKETSAIKTFDDLTTGALWVSIVGAFLLVCIAGIHEVNHDRKNR